MIRMIRYGAAIAAAVGILGSVGCTESDRSAQWYMAHGEELQSKLTECKKYPSLNGSDRNCKAASEAFATLISATRNAKAASTNDH